jgi:hypothetical protein
MSSPARSKETLRCLIGLGRIETVALGCMVPCTWQAGCLESGGLEPGVPLSGGWAVGTEVRHDERCSFIQAFQRAATRQRLFMWVLVLASRSGRCRLAAAETNVRRSNGYAQGALPAATTDRWRGRETRAQAEEASTSCTNGGRSCTFSIPINKQLKVSLFSLHSDLFHHSVNIESNRAHSNPSNKNPYRAVR